MPPRLTRQWLVPGVSRKAAAPFLRAPRGAAAWCASPPTCRPYSDENLARPDRRGRGVHLGVILPHSIKATTPDTLIAHLEPVGQETTNANALLLLTPSFASWLKDDHTFLSKAVNRLFPKPRGPWEPGRTHVVAAVVDKLPAPIALDDVENPAADAQKRAQSPPVSETGFEGLAYALFPDTSAEFLVEDLANETGHDDKGTITFETSSSETDGYKHSRLIQLALANTVFQTGSSTTMISSVWNRAKDNTAITLHRKRNVAHRVFKLSNVSLSKGPNMAVLSTPLLPLSLPRVVEAGMGNIVRRVTGPGGASALASQELEEVVPRYFKSRGEPPQSISVWALVIPSDAVQSALDETNNLLSRGEMSAERDPWEALWSSSPPTYNPLVSNAISKGARLHRVLSGGGGWGKKAGLLSLDPLTPFPGAKSLGNESLHFSDDLSSALQQVVEAGESIQFFTVPSVLPKQDEGVPPYDEDAEHRSWWNFELGTIPSTTDTINSQTVQQTSSSTAVSVFRHTFGALTEGEMSLKRLVQPDGSQQWWDDGGFKIDAPFTRFSVATLNTHEQSHRARRRLQKEASEEQGEKQEDRLKESSKDKDMAGVPTGKRNEALKFRKTPSADKRRSEKVLEQTDNSVTRPNTRHRIKDYFKSESTAYKERMYRKARRQQQPQVRAIEQSYEASKRMLDQRTSQILAILKKGRFRRRQIERRLLPFQRRAEDVLQEGKIHTYRAILEETQRRITFRHRTQDIEGKEEGSKHKDKAICSELEDHRARKLALTPRRARHRQRKSERSVDESRETYRHQEIRQDLQRTKPSHSTFPVPYVFDKSTVKCPNATVVRRVRQRHDLIRKYKAYDQYWKSAMRSMRITTRRPLMSNLERDRKAVRRRAGARRVQVKKWKESVGKEKASKEELERTVGKWLRGF